MKKNYKGGSKRCPLVGFKCLKVFKNYFFVSPGTEDGAKTNMKA